MSLLITVPVFGQHDYTHALVEDLEREGAEYLIVDNRGDYPKIGNERVTTPGENLGWAGGSERGMRIAFAEGYSHAMTLNNDTRLSRGFVTGLLGPGLPSDAGIVGPMIDQGFPCAIPDHKPAAANYNPRPRFRSVPAVEGTALMMSRECWEALGGMDLRNFGRYNGWGVDLDLAIRARNAGFGVYVTEMAYINHFGGKTAKVSFGRWRYEWNANVAVVRGMGRVHGRKWRDQFDGALMGEGPSGWRSKAMLTAAMTGEAAAFIDRLRGRRASKDRLS